MGHVVLLGAGFSRAVSSSMPTLATLGPMVVEALDGAGSDDLARFGGNLEEYLSHIGTDQPWLSDEDNLLNRAQFSRVVLAIRDVIVRAESVAAKQLPEWLGRLASQWRSERAAALTSNYDTLLETPHKNPTDSCDTPRSPAIPILREVRVLPGQRCLLQSLEYR